jgi:hypothetical protein
LNISLFFPSIEFILYLNLSPQKCLAINFQDSVPSVIL